MNEEFEWKCRKHNLWVENGEECPLCDAEISGFLDEYNFEGEYPHEDKL